MSEVPINNLFCPPPFTCPAVSVIVPMYNAARYIGECLDSLLAQTFQNFEVIVVDDCSTDDSRELVEGYRERFGGRLKLATTQKNSGGGGYVPRNIGLGLSRGEYVFFVDADDFITKTALEELHTAAKNYDADVVYTGAYYLFTGTDTKLERDGEGKSLLKNKLEDKPTLTIDAPKKNLQRLLFAGNHLNPWTKFVRREFLIENEITFPKIFSGGDFIWTITVFYFAKRLLRISTPIYFYRNDATGSITRKKDSSYQQIVKCVSAFLLGIKALQELSTKVDLLKNPNYSFLAGDAFSKVCLDRTFKERMQIAPPILYEILYREFAAKNDSFESVIPLLFSVIDEQQKKNLFEQQQFNQFAAQAKARIAALEAEIRRLKNSDAQ